MSSMTTSKDRKSPKKKNYKGGNQDEYNPFQGLK